ncbi:acyl-CoA dehydrogenase family protein [Streptomyces sp. NPDC048251]|uniref:acyl-CoA dehydrogenase family protein n=1 Tax=Streptomyces sp. NPDC048251 TaxID=3154501 RepID=UPI0034385A6B
MELDTSPHLKDFREEARTWLEENVPGERRPESDGPEVREYDAEWHRRQYEGGWAGIDWEPEYGGRGLSLIEQVVWYEELVRAKAPGRGIFSVAFGHAGPTLIVRGSEQQKAFHLPKILKGETPWCQGFSEPDAGSDLASLRTRGVVDGDELVITGSKIWTSYAQWCDYGELLVRTDPDASKHKGLTWLIMDMRLPGVDIRPITSIDGWPHNCEVFYDEVRVPLTSVVDRIDNGWSVAMSTLAAERGPGFLDQRLELIVMVDELIDHARGTGLLRDDAVADRLADARAAAAALRSMAYYQVSTAKKGESPGAETTAIRAFTVQLQEQLTRLAIDILGAGALEWHPWTRRWLVDFAAPIAGGTKDILKNIIGERVQGLPR